MANYCGKSCEGCSYQEELRCPGCAMGPGRAYGGDCELANCCQTRKHESCATCTGKDLCGKYRGRDKIPIWRKERREQMAAQRAHILKIAPLCHTWFTVMFWVMIINTAVDLVKSFSGDVPMATTICNGIMGIGTILYGVGLLMLSREEENYRKAGICRLIGVIPLVLSLFIEENMPVLNLIANVVSFVSVFFEFKCHSEILVNVDNELSEKWQTLLKWKFAVLAAAIGTILFSWLALVGVLLALFALLGTLVVGVIHVVYLHQTMKTFQDFR